MTSKPARATPAKPDCRLAAGTVEHYLDTDLYEFEYADREDDVAWYRDLAKSLGAGLRVVELGAGAGRITVPLAQEGHQLHAVDALEPMLAALARNAAAAGVRDRIELVHADMRQVPLRDQSCDLVVAPFNALMHLYTWRDLLACFREAARVLAPGGTFAFDVQLPDLNWLTWDPNERHAVTRFTHPRTKQRLVYSTNHVYDPETQICHIRIYYDEAPPRGRRFVPPAKPQRLVHLAHRQIFPEELRMLVATAGLELESLTADFEGRNLRQGMESQVAVCTRPA